MCLGDSAQFKALICKERNPRYGTDPTQRSCEKFHTFNCIFQYQIGFANSRFTEHQLLAEKNETNVKHHDPLVGYLTDVSCQGIDSIMCEILSGNQKDPYGCRDAAEPSFPGQPFPAPDARSDIANRQQSSTPWCIRQTSDTNSTGFQSAPPRDQTIASALTRQKRDENLHWGIGNPLKIGTKNATKRVASLGAMPIANNRLRAKHPPHPTIAGGVSIKTTPKGRES